MITRTHRFSWFAAAMLVAGPATVSGQSERIELAEARAALQAALELNRDLRAQVRKLEVVNRNLGDSLRVANAEAEDFRKAYADMRLQMEALGLETVTDGRKGLEDRLVKAMGDIRVIEADKAEVSDALIALADAAMRFKESAVGANEAAAAGLDLAIEEADAALGVGLAELEPRKSGTMHDCKVVSVKKEFGVVVLNVGREAGVRVGMPFALRRVDRPIGKAIVVDARDHICAALIQDLLIDKDSPQVGDKAAIATTE